MKDFFGIFRSVLIFLVLFLSCTLAVSFGAPWVFDAFEKLTQSPLAFEGALRISMLGIYALLLLLTLSWVLMRGSRIHRFIWGGFAVSFFLLCVIFVGDRNHRLLEEYAWIRYTTSTFLFMASACAIGILRLEFRKRAQWPVLISWSLIALGLLYVGLDEIFQTHEWIQRKFATPGTDFVTEVYAVLTVLAFLVFIRSGLLRPISQYRMAVTLLFAGVCTYVVSVFLDTFDPFILEKLRSFANVLAADSRFVMSDAWYLIWSVKNSTNGFEEVFEHTAALLFLFGFASILFQAYLFSDERARPSRRRTQSAVLLVAGSVIGSSALVIASLPFTFPTSALAQKDLSVTPIASYFDGLFHTDELDFHPSQGVVVANEGRGNVYRFKDGRFEKIADPKKILRDTDSVAADATGVYGVDGNDGIIVRLQQGRGEVIASKKDGLVHPEGLAVVGQTLYILDESQKSLAQFSPGKTLEVWKPDHRDWKTPEGIAYDARSQRLIVSDDTTGAVFRIEFKKSIEKIAQLSQPEDIAVLKDGSVLVADSGWGAIFRLFPDGTRNKIIQFRRMYRDVQGVAIDDQGSVYATTADGFGSTSFMPSFLFKIDDVRL
ncbi:hypothetical protein HY627_00495 [Candidatus Uhrbacteria bacterium]|nr:hypothetical protein [Candidatus Uhrbacteria bacterium]